MESATVDIDTDVSLSTTTEKNNNNNKPNKQTNKKSKCSNDPHFPYSHFTGLLHSHLPYLINHHEHLSSFMQLYNTMTAQVLALP